MTFEFVALLRKQSGSEYSVMFPDFPDCIANPTSIEEAAQSARDDPILHALGMMAEEKEIPAPRTLEQIRAAKEDWVDFDGATILMVTIPSN